MMNSFIVLFLWLFFFVNIPAVFAFGQTYTEKSEKSEIVKKADRLDVDSKTSEELKRIHQKEIETQQYDLQRSTQEDKIAKIRD